MQIRCRGGMDTCWRGLCGSPSRVVGSGLSQIVTKVMSSSSSFVTGATSEAMAARVGSSLVKAVSGGMGVVWSHKEYSDVAAALIG